MLEPSLLEEQSGETSVSAWLQTLNNVDLAQYHEVVISEFDNLYQLSLLWVGFDEVEIQEDVTDGVDDAFWQVVRVRKACHRQMFADAIQDLHLVYTSSSRVKRLRRR